MVPAEELARRVARAGRQAQASRTLLLDLDGTLAPFAATPSEARVPAATKEALAALLTADWRMAIVSGRPVKEVSELIDLDGLQLFGSHGLEGSWAGSGKALPPPELGHRLQALAETGRTLAAGVPGVLVESKPHGVAFHDRRVARQDLNRWRHSLHRWLDRQDLSGIEWLAGARVLELRPQGFDKGRIIKEMPHTPGMPAPDHSLVGIGDDRTDEDMFRELDGVGLSVRVGRPGVSSLAQHRLPSPSAVRRFLVSLATQS
jgi:trehalose-phosphatase